MMNDSERQPSRREFVAMTTAAIAAASCLACGSDCDAAAATGPADGQPVDVGPVSAYPKNGVYDKFARSNRFFVIRNEGQIYASSAVCTHKSAPLTLAGQEIVCKKHGSRFSVYGTTTKGPAKNSLGRFGITEDANKHLIVDTSKSFGEKDWEKEGAFVKVG